MKKAGSVQNFELLDVIYSHYIRLSHDTLSTNPQLSSEIIYSLQKEVRDQKNALRTPFLELKNREVGSIHPPTLPTANQSSLCLWPDFSLLSIKADRNICQ